MQRGTPADAACQLCGRVETLGHCLGGYTHTLMSQMYSKRHGHAVHKIATSIQQGIKGDCPIFYDAEGHNRSARQLPQWLPPTQGSMQHISTDYRRPAGRLNSQLSSYHTLEWPHPPYRHAYRSGVFPSAKLTQLSLT
jgi:hypothetical protein